MKISDLTTPVYELKKYQKGPWKRFKHPAATDNPEQYVGGWEEYTKPQGIGAKRDPKVTKDVSTTPMTKRKKSKNEASIGPLVTRGDTGTGGHGTPSVPPKDIIGHETINPPEDFPPHREAPTSFVKKQVQKLNTDSRPLNEMIRHTLGNDFTVDYEVKHEEDIVGLGQVTAGRIETLSVKNGITPNAFPGDILSKLVGTIVRDADMSNANLSIKLVNPEDISVKRFLERFGFRGTSEGILKRNAGSIHPPSVAMD